MLSGIAFSPHYARLYTRIAALFGQFIRRKQSTGKSLFYAFTYMSRTPGNSAYSGYTSPGMYALRIRFIGYKMDGPCVHSGSYSS